MAIDDLESAQVHARDLLLRDLVRLRPLEERDPAHIERWRNDPEWQVLQHVVGPDHVGQGYGTDDVRVTTRYGFRSMGVHRIELSVTGFNARGRRAYEKAGFRVEGVRRESMYLDGAWSDEILMGLLRPDFEGAEDARRVAEPSA